MSNITIYDISVGIFTAGVTALINILQKAALQPDAFSLPPAQLIGDMKPLAFHVQSISKMVTKSMKRLLGTEFVVTEDIETSIAQLIRCTEHTLAMLQSINPKALEGKETMAIELPGGQLTGKQAILSFGIPSFVFHLQTTYAILRMKGVPLGKSDFMDPWNGVWNNS